MKKMLFSLASLCVATASIQFMFMAFYFAVVVVMRINLRLLNAFSLLMDCSAQICVPFYL